jgi:valyl-tRNA synthetase
MVDALPQEDIGARGFSEGVEFFIPLAGIIDVEKEKARNLKELGVHEKEMDRVVKKLGNEQFLSKAPPEVIEKNRALREALTEKIAAVRKVLSILGSD